MPKKFRNHSPPKQRDLSWKLRHALGHQVVPDKARYTRTRKHPKEDEKLDKVLDSAP